MIPVTMTYSAQTSANQTQDFLDSKMEKRKKGVFGPAVGKELVIYIDDLNMPKRENTLHSSHWSSFASAFRRADGSTGRR